MPASDRGGRPRGAWYDRQLERATLGRNRPRTSTPEEKHALDLARKARWRLRQGMTPRGTPRPLSAKIQAPPDLPIPELERCDLVDAAVAELRPYERAELGTDMDAIARDLVGEYVVAALAGTDPVVAMMAERSRYRHDRAALIYGLAVVDGLER